MKTEDVDIANDIINEQITGRCQCHCCVRNRTFIANVNKIEDESIREYFRNFLDYLLNVEMDNDFLRFNLNRSEEARCKQKTDIDIKTNLRNISQTIDMIADKSLRRYIDAQVTIIHRKLSNIDLDDLEKQAEVYRRELND